MVLRDGLVATLMQLRLQAMALATTSGAIIGTQRYHLLEGLSDIALGKEC